MSRGKKGHKPRSYGRFRKSGIAPRGSKSVRASWPIYLIGTVAVILVVWMIWMRHA
jgi:hypothetical protein